MAYYQHNMLSIKSRTLLANILAQIVLLSESIQTYREALANIDYFDCIALFRFLDRQEKGYLREKDFQRVIGTSHRKLLTYAFSWFDNMKVGEISRLQFSVFLLPKDNLQLRQLVAQRVQNPQISYSQHQTILQQYEIFRNLVLQIMNKEMIIIQLRRKLLQSQDYTSKAAISAIDCNGHNWIVADDIEKFMKNYGFNVNLRHVQKLVEVLNYNLDGKIVEEQLKWTVQGFQSNDKQYLKKIKSTNKKQHSMPSKSQPKDHKKSHKDLKQATNEWQLLSQRFNMAASQYKQIDKKLQQQQQKMIQENNRKLQQKLMQYKRQQQIQLINDREYNERLIESYRYEQMYNRIKNQQIEAMQQIHYYNDVEEKALQNIKAIGRRNTDRQGRRLYSFAEQSFEDTKVKPDVSDIHAPRRDYTNLTNLSNLSIVQSNRKMPSIQQTPYQLIDSSNYINTANNLKQRIKAQRQIQKSIQDKFKGGQYDARRFNSKVSAFNFNTNTKAYGSSDHQLRNILQQDPNNKRSEIKNNNDSSFNNGLGIQSNKRDDFKRYHYGVQNAIPDKINKSQIQLIKNEAAIYQSPEKGHEFYKSGGANKFTAATKAQQSSQK